MKILSNLENVTQNSQLESDGFVCGHFNFMESGVKNLLEQTNRITSKYQSLCLQVWLHCLVIQLFYDPVTGLISN